MEHIVKEIHSSILASSNMILKSNLKEDYKEIADYVLKEINDLKEITEKRIESINSNNKNEIEELYNNICSDYGNNYKVMYSIINSKINELNKKSTDYIENDIFKLICVTYVKYCVDSLFESFVIRFNLLESELV